jgi:hypothetical protein
MWAHKLNRHLAAKPLASDDGQLDPSVFHEMDTQLGPYTIDRFASALDTLHLRYIANWLDPSCEAVNSLHLADTQWREENIWCQPPWPLLPDLAQALQLSGA